jgi:hypothetical protein
MVFKPGVSGNPSGKPRDIAGIQELARSFGPGIIRMLNRLAKSKKTPPAARISAGLGLLDRGYGRPPSFSTTDANVFRRAVELSDDELIAIAAQSGLKLDPPVPRPTAQDAPASVGGNVGTDQSPRLGPNDI